MTCPCPTDYRNTPLSLSQRHGIAAALLHGKRTGRIEPADETTFWTQRDINEMLNRDLVRRRSQCPISKRWTHMLTTKGIALAKTVKE